MKIHCGTAVRLLLIVALFAMLWPHPVSETNAEVDPRVEALLASMSTRQKVGQLFMISLGGGQLSDAQVQFLQTYQPGSISLFGRNVEGKTPEGVTTYVNNLQTAITTADGVPLFVAIDHEGGRVQRLMDGFTQFPEPSIIGATNDPAVAEMVGMAMGRELSAVGINFNLAPVADLLTRDDMLNTSRVLNHRTLSQDPQLVGELAAGIIRGMSEQGVLGTLKHFPGHAQTDTDSHAELATVLLDRETALATNIRAFEVAIQNGAESVMLGHLYYPALEPSENLPASLSPTLISLLRDDLQFDGLIITDALDMGAVVNQYPIAQASVMAFNAGVDMLVMGPNAAFSDQLAAMDAVLSALESGEVSMDRLDESVRRILTLKATYGLLDWQALDPATTAERMDTAASFQTLVALFEAGITVVRDQNSLLPLSPSDNTAIIYPVGKPLFLETCSQYLPDAIYQTYSWWPYDWEFGATQAAARNADIVVVIAENIGWNTPQAEIVAGLPLEKVIYVSLWKPFEWEDIAALNPNTPGFIATYSTQEAAQIALCNVISGQAPMRGRLPVAIDGYAVGTGVQSP